MSRAFASEATNLVSGDANDRRPTDMRLDGFRSKGQALADCRIGSTFSHEGEDLALTFGEVVECTPRTLRCPQLTPH